MLRASDQEVFDAIRYLDCTPDISDTTQPEVAIAIEGSRDHYWITEDGALIGEVGTAKAVVEALHVHLFRRSIEERPQTALLHAACLRRGDRRLLVVGSKGAGKTTLALRLIAAGYDIEGDEHVFIEDSIVIARPRGCRVKAAALPLLGEMTKVVAQAPSYTDEKLGTIFNVDPRMLGGTWRIDRGRADAVIVLQPNHGGLSSIRSLPPMAVVQSLMPEAGLRETGRGAAIAAIAAMVGRAKGFQLLLGDHPGALRCIESALVA